MLADIQSKFDNNVTRVRNLVDLYVNELSGPGQGRRPVNASDVLRAATVLLHATLEEFLRAISRWKLPSADEAVLNAIPLAGLERPDSFRLGRLTQHRGKTVNKLILESVETYLQRSNYNSTTEIANLLQSIHVDTTGLQDLFPRLALLIERRHQIVHRADQNEHQGSGYHRANSVSVQAVRRWIDTVIDFAARVSHELEP